MKCTFCGANGKPPNHRDWCTYNVHPENIEYVGQYLVKSYDDNLL